MVSDLGIRFTNPWKFTANLGGGVNYLLHDHLSGNLQFRDSISGVPAYGLPATGISGFSPRGLMNNILISAGLVYEWDSSH